MNYSTYLKCKLLSIIREMETTPWLFSVNPSKDFSRVKKWSFSETMSFIISMEGKSVRDELLNHFEYSETTPTNSSFNQRRSQILPEAFGYIFQEFNKVIRQDNMYHGYRLLACDGSDLPIARKPEDPTTYFQALPYKKGYNQIHLNALYDLRSRTYVDAIIQYGRQQNEDKAMCDMVDRYRGDQKTIFIADRGYENYNLFAHIHESKQFYLIRAKDLHSNGIISSLKKLLPNDTETFDETVTVTITKKQTKEVKSHPEKYRVIMKKTIFDYVDPYKNQFYDIKMRIVRFPISDKNYECIITNLPYETFTSEEIKKLYHMRWGIETSFRELKYAVGLTNFHAQKKEYIIQEIWARLILYNFCEAITVRTVLKLSKRQRKYEYQLNYTRAIHICRYFLSIRKGAPPDVEILISKELLPVRPGRSNPRKVKVQSAVSFLYRVA